MRSVAGSAFSHGVFLEAELGRLAGSEDDLGVEERVARMTDPSAVAPFVRASGADALAVCIGNVHGPTPREPVLDLSRLEAIRGRTDVPLVLHGASGLSPGVIRACVDRGISKINVNTELRSAFLDALAEAGSRGELASVLASGRRRVASAVSSIIDVLGSTGLQPASSLDTRAT